MDKAPFFFIGFIYLFGGVFLCLSTKRLAFGLIKSALALGEQLRFKIGLGRANEIFLRLILFFLGAAFVWGGIRGIIQGLKGLS